MKSTSSDMQRGNRLTKLVRSKALCFYIRVLSRVLGFLLIASVGLEIVLAYGVAKDVRILPSTLRKGNNFLLVTAHPDDECLFFSPTVLGVLDGNAEMKGGLLVLSAGNNYGIGETRKKELKGSCEALGIDSERCVVLDEKDLPDNPKLWWNEDVIMGQVKQYIKKWKVDIIVTFDEGGVSGHINHRAVSSALRKYAKNDPKAPAIYTLYTTSLPRKYTFILDLPLTAFSFTWRIAKALLFHAPTTADSYNDKALIISTWGNYLKTRAAFRSHETQYSWDRNLYMILSRYVWFNDLRRVPGPPR